MGCLARVQRTEGLDLECEDEEQNWLNSRGGDGKYAAEEGRKRLASEGVVVVFGVTEAVEAAAMLLVGGVSNLVSSFICVCVCENGKI